MYSLGMLSVLTVGVLLPFGYPFLLSNSIEVWVTNDRRPDKLTGKSPIMPSSSASGFNITVDRNKRYQSILGFGASITSSSAWNIYHSRARDAIMEYLFNRNYDKDGIGKKISRHPVYENSKSTAFCSCHRETITDTKTYSIFRLLCN